jgi:tripartite-type tricarboxylate transporter receptor subunit TctC
MVLQPSQRCLAVLGLGPDREGRIMRLPRRQFLHLAAGTVAFSTRAPRASAQTYPARPITMIAPFSAGGAVDAVGRIVAERMRRPLGQPITIENVGGADGSIGTGRVARAKPDGYTIEVASTNTHVLNGAFLFVAVQRFG